MSDRGRLQWDAHVDAGSVEWGLRPPDACALRLAGEDDAYPGSHEYGGFRI